MNQFADAFWLGALVLYVFFTFSRGTGTGPLERKEKNKRYEPGALFFAGIDYYLLLPNPNYQLWFLRY